MLESRLVDTVRGYALRVASSCNDETACKDVTMTECEEEDMKMPACSTPTKSKSSKDKQQEMAPEVTWRGPARREPPEEEHVETVVIERKGNTDEHDSKATTAPGAGSNKRVKIDTSSHVRKNKVYWCP